MLAPGQLRKLLEDVLPTGADFAAFCCDYFPHVSKRFSVGMDRLAQTTLLLELAGERELLAALQRSDPERLKKAAQRLGIDLDRPSSPPAPEDEPPKPRQRSLILGLLAGGLALGAGTAASFLFSTRVPADMVAQSGGAFTLTDPYKESLLVPKFLLDRHEVTRQDFLRWLYSRTDVRTTDGQVHDRVGALLFSKDAAAADAQTPDSAPITGVTYVGAAQYCQAQGKRLPRYEEWDLAARGGAQLSEFPWGEAPPVCAGVVFGRNPARGGEFAQCSPAGPAAPSAVGTARQDRSATGVSDLAGNVSEWVQGKAEPYARGGSWARDAQGCKTSYYVKLPPGQGYADVGFRCAKDDGHRR